MAANNPEPSAPRSKPVMLLFASIAGVTLLFGLVAMLRWDSPEKKPREITVLCAAGLRAPVEAAAKAYEQESGVRVNLSYGGSQTLLANAEVSKTGDLFIPADDSYIGMARDKKLIEEVMRLAAMKAMVAVKKGNPKQIRAMTDLVRPEVTISQANPDAAAIGKLAKTALQKAGMWEPVAARTTVYKGTVNDAVNDVVLGAADAAFAWDAMAVQYPTVELLPMPELSNAVAHIHVAILRTTTQPTEALRFARYLAAADKGMKQFEKEGFKTLPGDRWSDKPEINLFAGAMLRPAIDKTVSEFEEREGARVNRVYNGCGILVAEMQAGKHPDAYFACDSSFMAQVQDLFLDSTNLSANQLVILVPKGNPHGVKTLRDLAKPGLRLGVGHEKQCALGVLTRNTLMTNGTYMEVMKNVAVQSPTGDFLVNQLRAKSLDAVIAYVSNAAGMANELEAIAVDIPCANAAQPLAASRDANFPQLTQRLIERLKTAESADRFKAMGFRWTGAP